MSETTTPLDSQNSTTVSTSTTTVSTTTTTQRVTTPLSTTTTTSPTTTTLPQPTTPTKNIIQTTTVSQIPTTTELKQCPKLVIPHAAMSTDLRTPGTLVRLRCDEDATIDGPGVILCQESGYWNSSLPTCRGDEAAIPLSTKLFIGILTGCCALVLLVVIAILVKLWICGKGGNKSSRFSDRHHRLPRTSVDTLPPVPNPMHRYPPQDRRYNVYQGTLSKASDTTSTIYAKPEIYSTFINPAFYEDVYDRWRRRESQEIYAAGTIYDSPWQHRGAAGPDGGEGSGQPIGGESLDTRWSSVSLRAHDNYDYGRFGKIPRSQIGDTEQSIDTNL
ncbi:hypothetical protein LOTGIDRAFT_166185 [Lottia gigantea]|uniref:Sushi domain-containing protein n=1 Tax=Lottia gigantea TaxID=225164 RepID=V3ZAA4_LOTGI|nr:hypothetical protein LOTGIDRAFT_166185 [Lottia gigantea]ESO87883.1 hypothetical protein LOTGIDRAFT_166185 [Lottia gigantea]